MSIRKSEQDPDSVTAEAALHNGHVETDISDHSGDEDDNEDLFVPEDEYMPLEEADEDIDNDIFNPNRIPQDLERMLDERFDAEMELKDIPTTDDAAPKSPPTAISTAEGSVEHKPDPLKVSVTTPMSSEHISQIRNVMAGIQLSEDAIPEWAKRVPESAWMPKRQQEKASSPPENAQT